MSLPAGIPFVKATACGNDFILIDAVHAPADMAEFTRRICDRFRGVGADGVEWLSSAPDAHVRARLINADGSDAEISGNGTRCVAAHYAAQHGGTEVIVRTDAGLKRCVVKGQRGVEFDFEMELGEPELKGEVTLALSSGEVRGFELMMGNPQYLVFVDEFPANWRELGTEIGKHPHFPQGTNVEFIRTAGEHQIDIRIIERGAGETQSSGTGSSASAVASIATGRAKSPAKVVAPGGAQVVRYEGGNVFLEGPARLVCRGEFFG